MTDSNLLDDYFSWLVSIIDDDEYRSDLYDKLLHKLYYRRFHWIVPMDENRADDGLSLRDKFISECEMEEYYWNEMFPPYASVLEVLVALACRMEDDILYDPDYGDRAHEWFWLMIRNLGLDEMDDSNYEATEVDEIIDIFLDRRYGNDGKGSLFPVKNGQFCGQKKWSETEIWYQMNFFLEENS